MRALIRGVLCAALLLGGGYGVYRQWGDDLRPWFESAPRRRDPLKFLRSLPDPPRREAPVKATHRPQAITPPPVSEPADGADPVGVNQVPNPEVAQVLMQILRAKKLASGLNLAVSDTEVTLSGTVASSAELQEIVRIAEKGRESRRINSRDLKVAVSGP